MSTTIDSLQIEILSNSQNASSGIDVLSQSLAKLKDVTKGGLGLSAVSKHISSIGTAVNNINSGSSSKIEGLANALKLLSGIKISPTISTNLTSISTALNGLKIEGAGNALKVQELVTALEPLSQMPKQNISQFINQLDKIPTVLEGLNKVDMNAFKTKILEVADAVRPLATEMEKVAAGFSSFPTKIQKLLEMTNKSTLANTKHAASFATLATKITVAYLAIKKIVSMVMGAIGKMSDYVENINLFNVSMKEYASEAKSYAETVGEAMGIDPGEWMYNQGIFMTLATGFGVASDKAKLMSENLTQLGYDISSFYNISIEDAMEKLQSGLAGELEPLRRIGYDLSQVKLEATALELGINKSVSSMTQAEKAMLRYYAIMTQVENSHGDMARTLDAPANQMRVFRAQIEMLGRAFGSIFIPALNGVLPYLIAATKILRELIAGVASLMGFDISEFEASGVESMANSAEGTSSALEDATESAKKLKSYMMGFDELNVLNPDSGSSSSGDGLGTFDIDLPTYDFLEKLGENRVKQIVDSMKEWLGLTEDIDTWSELFDTRLGDILETVGLIGLGMLAWKVVKGTVDIITDIKELLKNPTYAITISVIATITGITLSINGIKDSIKNGLDGFNFAEIVGGILLTAGGMAILGTKIAAWIGDTFASTAFTTGLAGISSKLGIVALIVGGVAGLATGLYDAITTELSVLNGMLIDFSSALIGAGIGFLIAGPLGAAKGAAVGAIIGGAIDAGTWLIQNTEDVYKEIAAIVGGIPLAVGAILAFTGINIPLGIALMAIGAVGLASQIAMNTDALSNEIKGVIAVIETIVTEALLVVGAILAFSGTNIPLGIALMAGGVLMAATVIAPNWSSLSDEVQTVITTIMGIVGPALLVVGAILAFSGVKLPLGIALMATGALNLGGAVALNWNAIMNALRGPLGLVTGIVSAALLAVGAILAFTGVKLPLGIALMAAGAVGLATVVALNWKTVVNAIKTVVSSVMSILAGAGLVLGVLLCLSGVGVPLGLALIYGAMKLSTAAWSLDDNPITNFVKNMANGIINIINMVIVAINDMFHIKFDGLNIFGAQVIPAFDIRMINIPKIPLFAEGGFPAQGQMFIANEAGPELVGNIGRKTAVANNDQIVESISVGVAEANSEQNMLLREQNSLLRQLLDKDSGVYLDGRSLSDSVDKYKREQGRVLIIGGAL